jgi:hypothetical protein
MEKKFFGTAWSMIAMICVTIIVISGLQLVGMEKTISGFLGGCAYSFMFYLDTFISKYKPPQP